MLVVLWVFTILIASDESLVLAHIGKEKPEPGPSKPYQEQETLRICTLNWGGFNHNKFEIQKQAKMLAAYHPDILFLQEIHPWQARIITDEVYGSSGDYRTGSNSAILTRWKVHVAIHNPMKHSIHATLRLPDGRFIDCVNFHLRSAKTNMRLWDINCWKEHALNRKLQRREVLYSLDILEKTTPYPTNPVVVGGDFNAPASDPLHDILRARFSDSFSEVGTGWPNTWHRRLPIHRIDYIYTSPLLKPVRSHTVIAPASDHRMLVSDFVLMP